MPHERPVLSSCNETMPGRGTLHHTPCTSLPRPLLFGPTKGLFFFFASCSSSTMLRLLAFISSKSHCLLFPRTGEQGQIYRKSGLPQGVTPNNVARFLSRFKSSSLVRKLLSCSIIKYFFTKIIIFVKITHSPIPILIILESSKILSIYADKIYAFVYKLREQINTCMYVALNLHESPRNTFQSRRWDRLGSKYAIMYDNR